MSKGEPLHFCLVSPCASGISFFGKAKVLQNENRCRVRQKQGYRIQNFFRNHLNGAREMKTLTVLGWVGVAVLSVLTFGVFAVIFFIVYYTYHGGPKARKLRSEQQEAELLETQIRQKQRKNELARLDVPTQQLQQTGVLNEQSMQSRYASSLTKFCKHCNTEMTGRFCRNCGSTEFTLRLPPTQ